MPPLSPEQMVKPARFEARMALTFGILFFAPGVYTPYFPIWLEERGFSPGDIAIILSTPMFLRVFTTPVITTLADRSRDRANVFILLVGASALVSLGYFLPPTYAIVLVVSLLLAVFLTPHAPMLDSIALSGVRRWGSNYPSMRVWGSISYLVGNLVGGLVLSVSGTGAVPMLVTLGLCVLLAASFIVPRVGPPRRVAQNALDAFVGRQAFERRFVYAIIGTGLLAGSHAFINAFMSIHWRSIGYGDTLIGFLWAFSVVTEVGLFWAFPRLLGQRSATDLMLIGVMAAILRWTVYPLVDPLGLGIGGYFFVQGLHAFSTGLLIIATQRLIWEEIGEERTGAAQGLAFLTNGTSMAAFTLLSGPLYDAFGAYGVLPMAGLAVAAGAMILLSRRQPQRPGAGGETIEPL